MCNAVETKAVPCIPEPARQTPVAHTCDVLVCGAGPAGFAAAISASRNGASTILLERSGLPGGAITQSMVMPLMTFHSSPDRPIVQGIAEELVQEVKRMGGSPGHIPDPLGMAATITPVDPELLKYAIGDMLGKAGVPLLLNTLAVAVLCPQKRPEYVIVENKSGRSAVAAKIVIDASGDADIASQAGVECVYGRQPDRQTQPMTLMFRMGGVDGSAVRRYIDEHPDDFVLSDAARSHLHRLPLLAVSGFFSLVRKAQQQGKLGAFRDRVLYFDLPRPGEVIVNMTRVGQLSGIKAEELSQAQRLAAEQVMQAVLFLQEYIPGFSGAYLLETASQIGVRETRHLVGRYTLTAQDVLAGAYFPDSVARGAFPIDIHAPDGSSLKIQKMATGSSYGIPYRCLLPKEFEGLLVAGRAISATHEASASTRLSPTCMALGQAAGTAAALACSQNIEPSAIDVALLQKTLVRQGAII